MPSQSHGRVFSLLALCLVVFFLVLRLGHERVSDEYSEFPFTGQYSRSRNKISSSIGNDTLGVRLLNKIHHAY